MAAIFIPKIAQIGNTVGTEQMTKPAEELEKSIKELQTKVNLVIEYCETRMNKKNLNGYDWNHGWNAALDRILGIVKSGKMYCEPSDEERKKSKIAFLKKRLKDEKSYVKKYYDDIEKSKQKIIRLEEELKKSKEK